MIVFHQVPSLTYISKIGPLITALNFNGKWTEDLTLFFPRERNIIQIQKKLDPARQWIELLKLNESHHDWFKTLITPNGKSKELYEVDEHESMLIPTGSTIILKYKKKTLRKQLSNVVKVLLN